MKNDDQILLLSVFMAGCSILIYSVKHHHNSTYGFFDYNQWRKRFQM